jgi:hypothetical protein
MPDPISFADALAATDNNERSLLIGNGFSHSYFNYKNLLSNAGLLYLKGERDTIYGIQKFLLIFPARDRMYIHIIFDGGKESEDIMNMGTDSGSPTSSSSPRPRPRSPR